MARSRAEAEVAYRALRAPWEAALSLFRFAGAWVPPIERVARGWGAWDADTLCGALLAERAGKSAMLHGPVVVIPSDAPAELAFDVADHLVSALLAEGDQIDTVFTRPQGLDRIWVRSGFIPVPEAELPAALRECPGVGLYGWRGGTALWSAAGRGPRARPGSIR